MNIHTLEKEVPFDQFSRQSQVAAIIKELKGIQDHPLAILDVGGYKGRTADFLPNEKVTVVDLYDVRDKNYIKGSALDLPFEDGSFDFVTSFDVLEHIPAEHRETFISECARVAKSGVIVCAPNKNELNQYTEEKLNTLYKNLHNEPHEWLKEHIEYTIPDFNWVEKVAQKQGFSTIRFHSNKTQLWFSMQQAIFINSKFPFGAAKLIELNTFYNKNFTYDGGGTEASSYRQILCCLKNKASRDRLEKKLSNLNQPINPILEFELYQTINDYYATLINKTTQLADDYQGLYEYYKNTSDIYEIENTELKKGAGGYLLTLIVRLRHLRSRLKV